MTEGPLLNIYEVSENCLEDIMVSKLKQPKYRAKQVRKCRCCRGPASPRSNAMFDTPSSRFVS